MKIKNIYVDMDGVLVNFRQGIFDTLGIDICYHYDAVNNHLASLKGEEGIKWWYDLEPIYSFSAIWKRIEKYQPMILTAYPPNVNCDQMVVKAAKEKWIKYYLGIPSERVILCERVDKRKFATPDSLLIDDHPTNVKEFQKAGGATILHTYDDLTMKQLDALGL